MKNIEAELPAGAKKVVKHKPVSIGAAYERFWAQVTQTTGTDSCWEWSGHINPLGYGQFFLYGRQIKAHRVAWMFWAGDPGPFYVCHRCDNPKCVRASHLFLGTALTNTADRVSKGRATSPCGIKNYSAKLDDEKVAAIRARYASGGISLVQLGRLFGVSRDAVANVVKFTTWKSPDANGAVTEADLLRLEVKKLKAALTAFRDAMTEREIDEARAMAYAALALSSTPADGKRGGE